MRRLRLIPMVCMIASLLAGVPARATDTAVELELVLLADASSSIRDPEFDLQVGGYANAFRDPAVIEAILALGGDGIAVTFVQWSATFQQFDTVPWRHLRSPEDAEAFADAVQTQARQVVTFGTATGSAMEYGAELFGANGFSGRRRVIDISSDERSNQGPHPKGVRGKILAQGVTINGLAILDDGFDLRSYFRDYVIGGPDSFVLTVDKYQDFAHAIVLKLVREISGKPLSQDDAPALVRHAWGTPALSNPSR
jgi:hypothetical protein